MNGFLDFAVWTAAAAAWVWACTAAWRNVTRHYDRQRGAQ